MAPEVITLLGGSALLVYSMNELSRTAQYIAGGKFRQWIHMFGKRRTLGILLGIVLSVLLSGSSAVTVMLVGLANARLLSLEQIFSVALGASIGSTLIVHLFTFNVSQYGLLILFFGVALERMSREDYLTRWGRGLLFLGLMFFSLSLLVNAGTSLERDPFFNYTVSYFRDRPLVSLLISTLLTALIHSSAATVGFVMSVVVARHGTILEALPWVLGANLGTTATALFASYGQGLLGKQAALGNLLSRLLGVLIAFPLMTPFGEFLTRVAEKASQQIALAHTLFNVAITILLFPFIPLGVRLVRYLAPERTDEGPFHFRYLDDRTLGTPELALAQAQREILRLTDTVEKMVERSVYLFKERNQKEIEDLKGMDQVVDFLNRGIKMYLTKLSQNEMTPEQVQKEFELLLRTNDLENIGDIVDKNILELVKKCLKKGYEFSKEGWEELLSFHTKVIELLRVSTAYFNSRDRSLLAKVLLLHQQIVDLTLELSEQHVQRLHRGVKQSMDTTSVHLDILGNLQRIADLSVNFTRVHGTKNGNA